MNQACVSCAYAANVVAGDYSSGGGLPICIQQGTIDAAGNLSITAKKCDSGLFGAGEYYLYVFDPSDGVVGNHCKKFNAQKGHISLAGNSNTLLTFPVFASSLVCGGAPTQQEKAYCVTKAAPNDTAWFGSQNMVKATDN